MLNEQNEQNEKKTFMKLTVYLRGGNVIEVHNVFDYNMKAKRSRWKQLIDFSTPYVAQAMDEEIQAITVQEYVGRVQVGLNRLLQEESEKCRVIIHGVK